MCLTESKEPSGLGYFSLSFSSTKEKKEGGGHFIKDWCNYVVIKDFFLKFKDSFNVICLASDDENV